LATGTYSGDPSSSSKDMLRFIIGDTVSPFILGDLEIDALIAANSMNLAASIAARTIGAYYARVADQQVGSVKITYAKTADHFFQLSETLASDTSQSLPYPYAGGISITDKDSAEEDTDRVEPAFTKELGMEYSEDGDDEDD
jgi:hypothetical protein